jgi:hypothetical protein
VGPSVVHAEIWPGIVNDRVAERLSKARETVKDAAQVVELCVWAQRADEAGELTKVLRGPENLTLSERIRCVTEEGWILGAP